MSQQALDEMQVDVSDHTSFGVGDFPRTLHRFNWGAFLLPEVWPFFNGMSEIGIGYWALVFGASALSLSVPDRGGVQSLLLLLPELLVVALTIVLGARANSMRWARQARALAAGRVVAPLDTRRFVMVQRRWMIGGWFVVGMNVALVLVIIASAGPTREWSMAIGILIARIAAAAIVAGRLAAAQEPLAR